VKDGSALCRGKEVAHWETVRQLRCMVDILVLRGDKCDLRLRFFSMEDLRKVLLRWKAIVVKCSGRGMYEQ
jgi:hypothetical protein